MTPCIPFTCFNFSKQFVSVCLLLYFQVCTNFGEWAERHLRGLFQYCVPLRLAAQPRALDTRRLAQVLRRQVGVGLWRWRGRGRGGKDVAGARVAAVSRPTAAHGVAHHMYRGLPLRAHVCQRHRLEQQHEQRTHRLCRHRFRTPPAQHWRARVARSACAPRHSVVLMPLLLMNSGFIFRLRVENE